jgi:hypothetical protein
VAAPTKTADELVDGFVSYLNATGFEPKSQDEVPEELRGSSAEHRMFHWQIRPASSNPWSKRSLENSLKAGQRTLGQLSALHGLNHWHEHHAQKVEEIVDDFLLKTPGLSTRIIEYAGEARAGGAL